MICGLVALSPKEGFFLFSSNLWCVVWRCIIGLMTRDPRPYMIDSTLQVPHGCEKTLGFPSGHIAIATNFYSLLLIFALRRLRNPLLRSLLIASVVILLVLTGAGRVVAGVHTVGQVLGGFWLGIGLLWILVPVFSKNTKNRLTLLILAALVSIGTAVLTRYFTGGNHLLPEEWTTNTDELCPERKNKQDIFVYDSLFKVYTRVFEILGGSLGYYLATRLRPIRATWASHLALLFLTFGVFYTFEGVMSYSLRMFWTD